MPDLAVLVNKSGLNTDLDQITESNGVPSVIPDLLQCFCDVATHSSSINTKYIRELMKITVKGNDGAFPTLSNIQFLSSSSFAEILNPLSVITEILCVASEADVKKEVELVQLWCKLASNGLADPKRKRRNFCDKLCMDLWKKNIYVRAHVLEQLKTTDLSLSPKYSALLACLCNYLKKNDPQEILNCKNWGSAVISSCTDQDMFKDTIMPAIHRAVLRSAEANMIAVSKVLQQIPFELDFCAVELAKPLVKHLFALIDPVRRATIGTFCAIAMHCSEAEALISILKSVHAQILGPEGKKAGQEARLAGLTCLGELSKHVASRSASDRIGNSAIGLLVEFMEQESHEATLIYTTRQLTKWINRIVGNLPDRLSSFIKTKSFDLKTAPTLRCVYLSLLQTGLKKVNAGDRLLTAIQANLLDSVKRAVGQPNHSPVVFESVCASLIWLRYVLAKSTPLTEEVVKTQLSPTAVWTLLVGTNSAGKRRPWFSERFLQTAPDYALVCLAQLMELVLRELSHCIPAEVLTLCRQNLLFLSIHPHYATVRQPALKCVESLIDHCTPESRWSHASHMLTDMLPCLLDGEEGEAVNTKPQSETAPSGKSVASTKPLSSECTMNLRIWNGITNSHPESQPPGAAMDGVRTRCMDSYVSRLIGTIFNCVIQRKKDKEASLTDADERSYWRHVMDVYVDSVLPCSHSAVASGVPNLWERMRGYVKLPSSCEDKKWKKLVGKEYLMRKWTQLANRYMSQSCLDETSNRALHRLISWSPIGFGKTVLTVVIDQLNDSKFTKTSKREVQIMLTPPTQLFNQELLDSLPKYQKSMGNIKRDSKLYSYDVQLDILAAKKTRAAASRQHASSADEPALLDVLANDLTEKQLEAVREELAKEAEIRVHMLQLDMEARHLAHLLTNVLDSFVSQSTGEKLVTFAYDNTAFLQLCPRLSHLLVRLLASPLVAPYVLRAYVNGLRFHAECVCGPTSTITSKLGPKESGTWLTLIGWWSLRILGPARLLQRSDLTLLLTPILPHHTRLLATHSHVLHNALDDATSLIEQWSEESISEQIGRVNCLFGEEFTLSDLHGSLIYSYLCPTFEYLLFASGWARPLLEELPTLPFPALFVPSSDETSKSTTNDMVSLEVRERWQWVSVQHVRDFLATWLRLLHTSVDSDTPATKGISREVVLHVVPFASLFRLMRQLIEGSVNYADPFSNEDNQQLLSDKENDEVNDLPDDPESHDELNEARLEESKVLAQIAVDVLRNASHLLARALCETDESKESLSPLADAALDSLLTGTVAETAQAREMCLSCILTLIEKYPTFIELANTCSPATQDGQKSVPEAAAQPEPPTDEPEEENVDSTTVTGEDGKLKKRPNKQQRKKQKQAQMMAELVKAQGVGDQADRPYDSPYQWPPLSVWARLQVRLWVARSDSSTDVAILAERLWEQISLDKTCEEPLVSGDRRTGIAPLLDSPTLTALLTPTLLAPRLLLETTRPVAALQRSTADAFALCMLRKSPDEIAIVLQRLIQMYKTMLYREPPVKDSMGRILVPESPDRWRERIGLALALFRLPEIRNPSDKSHCELRSGLLASGATVEPAEVPEPEERKENTPEAETDGIPARAEPWLLNFFRFLVSDGLNDRNEGVQSKMLQAGLRSVEVYGKANIDQLLPILETFLNKAPNVAELDAVRQSVLIITGSLAQHLATDDARVWSIFNRLCSTLHFPSEMVQQAVEDCLATLVGKLTEEQKTKTITRLMNTLLSGAAYAERHGAAHGIAGIARGLGIMSLKHYGIIDKLLPALEDVKSSKRREGSLLLIERLCLGMGRLFEPYIIRLITGLLNAFGDTSSSVREAASNTARAVMSKLSAHGVRLILPALLRAIDNEQSWRSRAQSVELLATMTHCAPKQLSACLPQIVPRLLEVLVTSQDQLKQAGVRALKQIGSVIRNPEVQALVPLLTACLQDPLADKMPCLFALRDTCFVHILDAPSLALILPVIQRAFDDRSTEARKTAAQIFGNLHSLARKEELQPYVANILPPLKKCLLDAVPEIRSVAAAALGALVRGMGESCFKEILPWLISTLTSETSSVDRSGAAQGLAEVLGAMGIDRLRSILPDLIRTASSDSKVQAHVRDGYLMLFIYLPTVFKDSFAEFIGPIIPTILKSLSDETEFLRETALRAAQRIVQMFAESSVELLLPELERGIGDMNWRIRHASVQLLGDLLYQLTGLTGKGTTKTQDDDDTFGTLAAHERIKQIMGVERHDRVLARLHMVRSDPTLVVRQAAMHVWKIVVPNTSRTLREIMPVLIRILLQTLGTPCREQQQLAARALGDVVRKLGERILPEIIPLLLHGLDSSEPEHRRGVCTGLMEILRNCPREQLVNYTDGLLVPIRRTLCDPLPEVRRSGARTFELLYGALGVRALDGILPDLLAQLDDPEANPFALDGLRQLLVVKGKAVMPYLVPKLTYPTVNVKAFAYLASVAGDALSRQLNRILPALLTTVSQLGEGPSDEEDLMHCASVLVCIYDVAGVRNILNSLLSGLTPGTAAAAGTVTSTPANQRIACLRLLCAYLDVSFESIDTDTDAVMDTKATDSTNKKDAKKHTSGSDEDGSVDFSDDDEDDEDEDDDEEEDESEESENDEDDDGETDSDMMSGDDEELPDAKESVTKVLREFYPQALRNICRLFALSDARTLACSWSCLESLLKRWSPETVTSQINDLRQGVRGAVSEMRKQTTNSRGRLVEQTDCLPAFSDPKLPLANLVKLYAECTLRGRMEIRESAAQGLAECIAHASGAALQPCVIKIIGPMIRLLGERQTDAVRMAVVESLTALIRKCPLNARPFVTQLQATFLKCLGDKHRPMRLLSGHGLSSLVGITPKLDPLLVDLARVASHTVLTHWPVNETLPGVNKPDSATPSVGAVATALTLTGIATYPETSLHALRLCMLSTAGRAGLEALASVFTSLLPLMCLPAGGAPQAVAADDEEEDEDEDDELDSGGLTGGSKPVKPIVVPDAIRPVAASCIAGTLAAVHWSAKKLADKSANPLCGMVDRALFPKPANKIYERWTFSHSQAIVLLLLLKHAPDAIIAESLPVDLTERVEKFIAKLCAHSQSAVYQLGLRCIGANLGYLAEMPHAGRNAERLLQLLGVSLKHDLIDVRTLCTTVASHVAWRWKLPSESNDAIQWLGSFLTLLLTGSRDKAGPVRSGSEADFAVLCRFGANQNKESNQMIQTCLEAIDANNRNSLESLLQRLRKQDWSSVWSKGCPDMEILSNSSD